MDVAGPVAVVCAALLVGAAVAVALAGLVWVLVEQARQRAEEER